MPFLGRNSRSRPKPFGRLAVSLLFTLSRRYFLDKNIFVCYLIFAIGYLIVEPPLRIFFRKCVSRGFDRFLLLTSELFLVILNTVVITSLRIRRADVVLRFARRRSLPLFLSDRIHIRNIVINIQNITELCI